MGRIAMAVRGLRLMVVMPALGQPGHVHRAWVRQRQPRSSQAGSGQKQRQRQDAAPPEDS